MKKNKQISNMQTFLILFIILSFVIGAVLLISSGGEGKEDCDGGVCYEGDSDSTQGSNDGFRGDSGTKVEARDAYVYINESDVSDGNLHAFNLYSKKEGKTIYFFVVKADDGTYRVAANACEVCFGEKRGFEQVGDRIKCTNCGTTYSKDQIAKQKGGCNPGPIDPDPEVEDGNLLIAVADVEEAAYLF